MTKTESIVKIWRALNVVIFMAAFFGPWGTVFGDVLYGADWVFLWAAFVASLIGAIPRTVAAMFGPWYPMIWIALGAYWLYNVGRALGKVATSRKRHVIIPLVIATLFLLLDMLPRILFDRYHRFWDSSLYWGYWLLLLSVVSAVATEITDHISRRRTGTEQTRS